MGSAEAFTVQNFDQEVLGSPMPVLVDFTAAWCGPCQRLAPIIDGLAARYAGKVKVGKVDIDANQDLAFKYGINSVPTILIFKQGNPVETVRGYNPESVFAGKIDALLDE